MDGEQQGGFPAWAPPSAAAVPASAQVWSQDRPHGGGFPLVICLLSVVWSVLTVLKRLSMRSGLMRVSESEGLVLVEVAAPPPSATPCKVKWNQMSNKLLAPKGSFKTRSRAGVIRVRDGGFEVPAT